MKKTNYFLMMLLISVLAFGFSYCGKDSGEPDIDDDIDETQGTFTDSRDNKTYNWVKIGDQTWMTENLAYKVNAKAAGCWAYNDNSSNVATYGYLYNWEAAQSACPSGWHLPSDAEWNTLILNLDSEASTDATYQSEIAGGKMKEAGTSHWQDPNTGATNESGMTLLPSGYRHDDGSYEYLGRSCYLWTSTSADDSQAWIRKIVNDEGDIQREKIYIDGAGTAIAIRCIKD